MGFLQCSNFAVCLSYFFEFDNLSVYSSTVLFVFCYNLQLLYCSCYGRSQFLLQEKLKIIGAIARENIFVQDLINGVKMPSKKIKESRSNLELSIVNALKDSPKHQAELFKVLSIKKHSEYSVIKKVLGKLESNKMIVRDNKGVYRAASKKELIPGRITITAQGFGFVAPLDTEKNDKDIFVPAQYVNTAFDGDLVMVRVIEKDKNLYDNNKGPVGVVCEVVERKRLGIVGELALVRNGFVIKPLNRKLPDNIPVEGDLKGAKRGEWVKASVEYGSGRKNSAAFCEIQEIVGKAGILNNDLLALIKEYNLMPPYTEDEERMATKLQPAKIERKDLTSYFCVTIDPHDAKDFDDSVSYTETGKKNECIIGIHIADVAAWIQPGTCFDRTAADRGFTAYIPGNTLPMLPRQLTKSISLTTGKESFAHSVLLTVNTKTGVILKYERCHSKIRIAERLTFGQVEDYITKNKSQPGWGEELRYSLDKLVGIYKLMRNNRLRDEKFLDLAATEIRVLREEGNGEILGIEKKKQGEADKLVEEYMLAANSWVAKELTNRQIPGLYRIHPPPDDEKLAEFSDFVSAVFDISTGNLASGREACRHFLDKIVGNKFEEIIIAAFLRSLNRASYSEKSALHYGLGKGLYSHFTSPIRRYSDLIVHQQLWLDEVGKTVKDSEELKRIATDCTEKERNTDEAYYAANDRMKLYYLQKQIEKNQNQLYEGVIRTVSASMIFADITDIGVSACIPIEKVHGEFRRKSGQLCSAKGKTNFKPGDIVFMKIERIDFIKGSAIFRIVQF